MSHTPPSVLRIKRKRGEDPLQALILEGRQPSKKSKPATPIASGQPSPSAETRNWYFELDSTDDFNKENTITDSLLTEARNNKRDARQFVIPKKHTLEDSIIPHELTDMVADFLSINETTTRKKRKSGRAAAGGPPSTSQPKEPTTEEPSGDVTGDYVFDTYKLSASEPLTEANYPKSQIGYIRFFDDENYDFMHSDDDVNSNRSDDEDSNAESFYQNDYPEDEDAGALSDTYGSYDADEEEPAVAVLETPEEFEGTSHLSRGTEEFDNLYDELLNDNSESYDPDETFERQRFFEDEGDSELAIHRDRIFSRLQK
ncbi:hypothetical protein CXQ85_003984 [Candidozyma haemuli]|uniref:Transcription factor Iwr1 domain-containing protein n=1 Tax=Candidozyma haemuli TaxID=45357 RepID=A0A2V1B0P8_9ASCO|nr:hypothetical protein CXQ85_003984 [[Candida] haemuloni]PVH23692.1 hypothetical protein CXQ85_003984 [[Candida] haemuloni]